MVQVNNLTIVQLDHLVCVRDGNEVQAGGNHTSRHGLHPGTILVREWDGKSSRLSEQNVAKDCS
jgi:hypothetical protein